MREIAAGLASLGRGPDTMLVHMTPGEVQGLQAIALAHGGSLTINPHTGLPEAGFLKNILPALAAAAAVYFTGGAGISALGLGSAGTGAVAGGVTGALTNKENPLMGAAMGALGGYGAGGTMGAAMQSGMFGGSAAGAAGAGAGVTPTIGAMPPPAISPPAINPAFDSGLTEALPDAAFNLSGATPQLATPAGPTIAQQQAVDMATPGFAGDPSLKPPSFMDALKNQFPTTRSQIAAGLGALGTVGALDQPQLRFGVPQQQPSNYRKQGPVQREYDPSAPGGYYFTDRGILQPNFLAAKGGEVPSVPQLEDGGFVLTKKAVDGIGKGSNDRGQRAAAAGLGAIPIKGPGTGTSDSIPTTIDGKRPALVSNGEAYVPRDQVKRRGGAKKFYALMKAAERRAARA